MSVSRSRQGQSTPKSGGHGVGDERRVVPASRNFTQQVEAAEGRLVPAGRARRRSPRGPDTGRAHRAGSKLKTVAYLHDQVAIKQILEHLGRSPPEDPRPPPAVQEVVRAPVDEEGREIEAP